MIKRRIKRLELNVACIGEKRREYKVFVENPVGKRRPTRTRRRLEDNIKIDLSEIRREGVDRDQWWDLLNMARNLHDPFFSSWWTSRVSSRRTLLHEVQISNRLHFPDVNLYRRHTFMIAKFQTTVYIQYVGTLRTPALRNFISLLS